MKIFTWKQRVLVLTVTVVMVALFGLLGWGIGYLVDQPKAGIFIAVLLSYPFTQWMLIKRVQALYEQDSKKSHKDER